MSNTPAILAIYSICISLTFFFKYSDFGFIAAGKKYASEHVISKDFDLQLTLLGNSFSVSFLFSFLISILLIVISFKPDLLISDFENNNQYSYIASILLITLSISGLFQIFTNYIVSFFDINLKKYFCDVVSIFTALGAFVIFFLIDKTNQNWILIYFISLKALDLVSLISIILLSDKIFKIKLSDLITNFRIKKNLIKKGLKLSFASIIGSISYFIFYELDTLFLAKNSDLISISFYSIAALGPFVLKTTFSILFSPFNSIFNYIKNEKSEYKIYINKVIIFFFPITFISIITVALFSEEIIYTYVGSNYYNSIKPFIYLCLAWSFSFITYPSSAYLYSMEFNKRIILSGLISPLFFWILNFYYIINNGTISIETFCLNKMFSTLIVIPIYVYYLIKDDFIDINFLIKIIKSLFFSSLILVTFHFLFKHILFNEKNIIGLIFNVGLIGGLILFIKLVDLRVNKNQID